MTAVAETEQTPAACAVEVWKVYGTADAAVAALRG